MRCTDYILVTQGMSLMRDLYSVLTINTLNEAFCERHFLKCPPHEEMERECAKVHLISEQVNQGLAYLEKEGVGACTDSDVRVVPATVCVLCVVVVVLFVACTGCVCVCTFTQCSH